MSTDPLGGGDGRQRPGARLPTVLAVATATVLLAACGSPPRYQYVANTDRSMVVRLPVDWKQIDVSALGLAASTSARWTAVYDGSGQGNPGILRSKLPIPLTSDPVVQMLSIRIEAGQKVTDDELRDALTPNTVHELLKLQRQGFVDDAQLSNYLHEESKIDTSTAHGLRIKSLYAFDTTGILAKDVDSTPTPSQESVVVDKLAVTDRANRHLHVIQISCSAACYRANTTLIDQIMSTYTVKAQS
jgi:hypothetical protein